MAITLSSEQVTPEQAAVWLSVNSGNRPVSAGLVARLASDIKNGRWKETGDTIKLTDGCSRLIDGQHRLMAVVDSGVPIVTGVARGVDESTFAVQDTGKKRTAGDIFHAAGYMDTNAMASAVRKAMMLMSGLATRHGNRSNISTIELLEYMKDNEERFLRAARHKHRMTGIMLGSLYVAFRYAFDLINEEKSEEFFEALCTGAALRESDPAYVLREKLRRMNSNKDGRRNNEEALIGHITIKAFKLHLKGKTCRTLIVRQSESFPSLLSLIPEEYHLNRVSVP